MIFPAAFLIISTMCVIIDIDIDIFWSQTKWRFMGQSSTVCWKTGLRLSSCTVLYTPLQIWILDRKTEIIKNLWVKLFTFPNVVAYAKNCWILRALSKLWTLPWIRCHHKTMSRDSCRVVFSYAAMQVFASWSCCIIGQSTKCFMHRSIT